MKRAVRWTTILQSSAFRIQNHWYSRRRWKQAQNVKTKINAKTKIIRPRPRPRQL